MISSFKRRFIFLLLLPLLMRFSFAATPTPAQAHFLVLSDIHFDPFVACAQHVSPCPLIQKLRAAPASQWSRIFATYAKTVPQYREDTDYSLLTSSLLAAKNAATLQPVQFVLITGDFLGHHFHRNYKYFSLDGSRAGFQAFTKKTYEFLANEMATTFPATDVYQLVGNNDYYKRDYYVDSRGPFFADMAPLWASLVKTKANQAAMKRQFPIGGYYAVDVPSEPHLRLIALNTVIFSTKAHGPQLAEAATQELTWLHNELQAAKSKQQKVLIAMHIPQGVDVFASLRIRLFTLFQLWEPQYIQRFQAELQSYAPEIMGVLAGHLHTDWVQVISFNHTNEIPVIGTPSISPIFGNNPGFKLFSYLLPSLQLYDYVAYYDPLNTTRTWTQEYDFRQAYEYNCEGCPIVDTLSSLRKTTLLAASYQRFYTVSAPPGPFGFKWTPSDWWAVR